MLLTSQTSSLEDLNLSSYEVLPTEPLHDVKEQIKNIMEEIPRHLTKDELSEFKKLTEVLFDGKEKRRGTDYRKGCIIVSKHMRGKWRESVQRIFDSMVEISKFCYAGALKRSPKTILRFHNQTFLHAMRCKMLVGNKPKALTRRKFYGRYFHSFTLHAPLVYRITSLSSIHTEEEERTFSTVNSIANTTSCRRHDEIISPTLIRLQVEQRRKSLDAGSAYQSSFSKQNSEISKISATLDPPTNTIIPHFLLLNYPHEYQAHLERIGDFLLPGENIWWSRDLRGVEFHDGHSEPDHRQEGPTLHHFRYSSLPIEQRYLSESWLKCLEKGVTILHLRLSILRINDDGSRNVVEKETGYFEDDDEDTQEDDEISNTGSNAEAEPTSCDHEDLGDNSDDNEEQENDLCGDNEVGFVIEEGKNDTVASEDESTAEMDDKTSTSTQLSKKEDLGQSSHNTKDRRAISKKSNQSEWSIKTDLAKNVSKLVSDTELVTTLDKCRLNWKTCVLKHGKTSTISQQLENKYLDVLARAQTKVLAAYDPLKATLTAWDENFFLCHQREPQLDD